MSYVVYKQRLYDASVDAVWAIISDHCGMHRWLVPGMKVRLEPEGVPAPNGVGAVRVIERVGFKAIEKVVLFEPPHRMNYTVLKGFPIKSHLGEVVLQAQGEQTQVSWTVTFDPKYPGTGWFLKAIVNNVIGNGLKRLASLV